MTSFPKLSKWDIPVPHDIDPLCYDNNYFSPYCHHYFPSHAHLPTHPPNYFRKHCLKSADIAVNDRKFVVKTDVHNFSPDELLVHFNENNQLIIEGRHEEKKSSDDESYVTRHFKRRYEVPDDIEEDQMVCNLSSDGILTVHVPRKPEGVKKVIPIVQTNKPHHYMNVPGI